ncbi:MAG TPA: response regulator [Candidatus Limnocylindrales bacterium]|nr:response regulator [Candidatus Limnocylindrales bacterium]
MTRILVIEDDAAIRDTITDVLEYGGYTVISTANGITGLALAQSEAPDLILCDIMLPGLDGYGVKLALNEEPRASSLPFIFLTARTTREDVRQAMAMGADDFLVKPFGSRELLDAVAARLHRNRQIASARAIELDHVREYINLALPHELRTPLTSILGYLYALRGSLDTMDTDAIQEMLGQIERSAMRLNHLIERYVAYAQLRVVAGSPDLIQALNELAGEVPLSLVIREVAEAQAEQVRRLVDLTLDLQPGSAGIIGEHFERLVTVLLENAFKFSSPGTPVTVTSESTKAGYLIRVANQGRGMTADQIARVGANVQFERSHYEQQGVGLGLAIAQQIVRIYGGRLTITSTPGEETTVTVDLPFA